MFKIRTVSLALLIGFLALLSSTASADPRVKTVNGHVTDHQVFEGCESPFGVCGVGRVTGGIHGDLEWTVTNFAPTTLPDVTFFESLSTIHTATGDVRCSDAGSFKMTGTGGEGVHLCKIIGGSGEFSGASGYLQATWTEADGAGIWDYTGKVILQ